MKLEALQQDAKLSYFTQATNPISIYENQHFRWLNFGNITQSVMNLRIPQALTLPHQTYILLPFSFLPFNHITEIGLGGGNLVRFLNHYKPAISFTSVEKNHEVINCFNQFFNPEKLKFNQFNGDSNSLSNKDFSKTEWLIYDIFSRIDDNNTTLLSEYLTKLTLSTGLQCLSINVPQSTVHELVLIEELLSKFQHSFRCFKFLVPKYQNTIYHLVNSPIYESYYLANKQNRNNLPFYKYNRWLNIWQTGIELTG